MVCRPSLEQCDGLLWSVFSYGADFHDSENPDIALSLIVYVVRSLGINDSAEEIVRAVLPTDGDNNKNERYNRHEEEYDSVSRQAHDEDDETATWFYREVDWGSAGGLCTSAPTATSYCSRILHSIGTTTTNVDNGNEYSKNHKKNRHCYYYD